MSSMTAVLLPIKGVVDKTTKRNMVSRKRKYPVSRAELVQLNKQFSLSLSVTSASCRKIPCEVESRRKRATHQSVGIYFCPFTSVNTPNYLGTAELKHAVFLAPKLRVISASRGSVFTAVQWEARGGDALKLRLWDCRCLMRQPRIKLLCKYNCCYKEHMNELITTKTHSQCSSLLCFR
jgi:hypothetical protein